MADLWHSIETAPVAVMLLVWVPAPLKEGGYWCSGHFSPHMNAWLGFGIGEIKPTHWMPQPQPPAESGPRRTK